MRRTRRLKIAGLSIGLTVPVGQLAGVASEPMPDCEPAISGLFWFSDSTGLFDQDVESAYLLTEGAAGPVLGVAGLVGEDCRLPATWAMDWTPTSGEGGEPGYFDDGAMLVVYPLEDTAPGVLEVTAEHDGKTYGPIALSIELYVPSAWITRLDTSYWTAAGYFPGWLVWDSAKWEIHQPGYVDQIWLQPTGSWATGYRPAKIRLTLQIEADPNYSPAEIFVIGTDGGTIGTASATMTAGNTYALEMNLVFSGFDIGKLMTGQVGSGSGYNYITNIEFLD